MDGDESGAYRRTPVPCQSLRLTLRPPMPEVPVQARDGVDFGQADDAKSVVEWVEV
jgi:hypothetical protein